MTTRTDGFLEGDGQIFGIIEVKSRNRSRIQILAVYWQNTAQMLAFILHHEGRNPRYQLPR